MQIGDKIKMDGERHRYTVQACNDRFAILTKPFNAQRCYLYCITDLKRSVRGRCNLIFGPPAELDTPEGAAVGLSMLETGDMEVSYRSYAPLTDDEINRLTS